MISELVNDDGSMARGEDVIKFSKLYDIPLLSISELIRYRRHREKLVTESRQHVSLPTLVNLPHTCIALC